MTSTIKIGFWTAATVLVAAFAFAASQDEASKKAEKIVNITCMACHDLRPIQTQALDAENWKKIVNWETEKRSF